MDNKPGQLFFDPIIGENSHGNYVAAACESILRLIHAMTFNTEVLIFETSEAFRENKEIITNALKPTLQAEGANAPGYYGIQIENPNTGYVIIHWDSYEIHQAFGKLPSFPTIQAAFRPSVGGKIVVYDVQFLGQPRALEQPVTEIYVLSLKAPENRKPVVDLLTKFTEASGNMCVFGQTHQDENKYVILGGWPTVEAHWETAKKPEVAAALGILSSLTDKEHLHHTSLSKYWP